jgi:hypothetical protein
LTESKTVGKFVNEYGGSVSNTFLKGKEGVFGAPDFSGSSLFIHDSVT